MIERCDALRIIDLMTVLTLGMGNNAGGVHAPERALAMLAAASLRKITGHPYRPADWRAG
jgi:hypothetical protein